MHRLRVLATTPSKRFFCNNTTCKCTPTLTKQEICVSLQQDIVSEAHTVASWGILSKQEMEILFNWCSHNVDSVVPNVAKPRFVVALFCASAPESCLHRNFFSQTLLWGSVIRIISFSLWVHWSCNLHTSEMQTETWSARLEASASTPSRC